MDLVTQESAKDKIQRLIDKYKSLNSGEIKKYTEEETKKGFIEPLFTALGWDISDKKEVTAEETQLQGRVDYGFYFNGRIKFYVEAKKLASDLHNEDYAKQAIKYSWNKGVDWAVLTDFESLKIFYCQDPTQSLFSKLVFEMRFDEYIDRLDKLLLLSKNAFAENELDFFARSNGKMMQKISVGDQLYRHLNECRKLLIENLGIFNEIKDKNFLDEGVQKLLDRLVFIRVAEDRGIEDSTLIPLLRAWETDKSGRGIFETMVNKFRELDDIYNSNLFTEHPFEKWRDSGSTIEKVINILKGKSGYYEYDFKVMPADVLGAVYENYLGHRLSESAKGIVLDKNAKKRKEQGIYYTPEFIVDYIVKNALKPVLDKCQSIHDLKRIKVLDPACGSGSFLIKALDLINEKYKEFGNKGDELTKIQILQENIYGVDLDEQAVEITRLNLLLNTLEERRKLPKLDKNIANGNSLISGTDEELKKHFGQNFRDKKPFNWAERFPEVFAQGGFDLIIGNPPWVFTRGEGFTKEEKLYFDGFLLMLGSSQGKKGRNIQSGKLNLYSLFILRSLSLLNKKGFLGFIVPNNLLRATNFDLVRKFILDLTKVSKIVDLGSGIFHSVTASSILIFLNKESNENARNEHNIQVISEVTDLVNNQYKKNELSQKNFYENTSFAFNILSDPGLSSKIKKNSDILGEFCKYISPGIDGDKEKDVTDSKISDQYKQLLFGKDISRYNINFHDKWVNYDRNILNRARNEEIYLSKKIVLQRVSGGNRPLTGTIDIDKFYTFNSVNNIVLKENSKLDIYYILGLINSSLLSWYYAVNFSNKSELTVNISKTYLEQLPIKNVNRSVQTSVIKLVKKILTLNVELKKIAKDSNKGNEIESEIERTDKKIDEEVYKLYGLTPEEIAIVEGIKN